MAKKHDIIIIASIDSCETIDRMIAQIGFPQKECAPLIIEREPLKITNPQQIELQPLFFLDGKAKRRERRKKSKKKKSK